MTLPARRPRRPRRSSAAGVGLPAVFGEHANRHRAVPRADPRRRSPAHEAGHEALPHATEWLLMAVSVAVAAVGPATSPGSGTRRRAAASRRASPRRFPGVYALVADKFRSTSSTTPSSSGPSTWLARVLWKVVDVLDHRRRPERRRPSSSSSPGDLLRFLQTGNVRNYALTFFLGLVALLLFVVGAI